MSDSWDPKDPALEIGRDIVTEWMELGGTTSGTALSIMIARELRTARERHADELYNAKAASFFIGALVAGFAAALWRLFL